MRTVTLENVEILFPNFGGRETQYNQEGNRNFNVVLPEDQAQQMLADGWNVKELKVREEGDVPKKIIHVAISYKNRPPHINLITSRGRNPLPEDLVDELDFVDMLVVDVTLRPYQWGPIAGPNGPASGVKAYLQTMFVTIDEDPLDLKYNAREDQRKALESGSHDIIEGEIIEEHYTRAIGG
jgi:hypothetical protein